MKYRCTCNKHSPVLCAYCKENAGKWIELAAAIAGLLAVVAFLIPRG